MAFLGYTVCISFAIGSFLFVVGGVFDFYSAFLSETQVRGSIDEPYFIGSIFYTVGSYAGLQATCIEPSPSSSSSLFWGYLNFTVGALLFNVCMAATILPLNRSALGGFAGPILVYLPACLGSILFVVGSYFLLPASTEGSATTSTTSVGCCRRWLGSLRWHVGAQNLVGSALFLVAASFGLWGSLFVTPRSPSDHHVAPPCDDKSVACDLTFFMMNSDTAHVKLPYVLGSACFLVASVLELWLWKREQVKNVRT